MARKTLYRNTANGKLTGLCAGFADYADLDISIVRILMLFMILFSGVIPGLAFYLIASAMVPAKTDRKK